ncbi:MAG: hypothetical protein RBJ76_02685 [Stenomitos frigidus ULC029]
MTAFSKWLTVLTPLEIGCESSSEALTLVVLVFGSPFPGIARVGFEFANGQHQTG